MQILIFSVAKIVFLNLARVGFSRAKTVFPVNFFSFYFYDNRKENARDNKHGTVCKKCNLKLIWVFISRSIFIIILNV